MRPIKSHTFLGKKYRIKVLAPSKVCKGEAFGTCDPPKRKGKSIEIASDLPDSEKLRIYIHEAIHSCNFGLSEDFVDQASSDIASFLERIGYILPEDKLFASRNK